MTKQSGFGDIEFYQRKKEIKERFNAIVPKLKALHQNHYYQRAVEQFRDVLTPMEPRDMGRLPLFSDNGLSAVKSKNACVLILISVFVCRYWDFCERTGSWGRIDAELKWFETLADKGLSDYDIKGEKYPGYYLRKM